MRTGVRVPGAAHWLTAVPGSAAALVNRELTWLALVGMAAWLLENPVLWPWAADGAAAAELWSVLLAGLLLLATQVRGDRAWRSRARIAVVAVTALVAVLISLPATTEASWEAGASLALLSAGLAGILLPARWALVVVALVLLGTLEATWRLVPDAGPLGLPTPFVPFYALALGLSMTALRLALQANAARIDGDIARRDDAVRQRGTVEGVEEALRRQERLLHETVLNTLTAINRGGLVSTPGMQEVLDARCREAVDVLTRLEDGAQALAPRAVVTPTGFVAIGPDLSASIDAVRSTGLPVDLVADSLEDVPDRVRGALSTAIREALANVVRHARASRATVLIRVRHEESVVVRVEVRDDGVGFDPRTTPRRFGLSRAVAGPMEEVGGSATIDSRPGQGTRVVLDWRARPRDALDRGPWRVLGLSPVATVAVFVGAMVALSWMEFEHPPVTVPDIALISVLAVLIAMATPEAPLPWSLVVTVGALGPLLALLALSSTGGPFIVGGWALAAVGALYMVVAAIGPPYAWTVLLACWVLTAWVRGEGGVSGLLADAVVLVVVGGALFGRALRRDLAAMERSHERRVAAETALDVTREGVARLRSRYEALQDSTAADLLTGILEGELDPDDPDVRRRAGLEESYIRTLIRIDPGADDLRRLAAELSRTAHRREVPLSIELAVPGGTAVVVPARVAGSFRAAMAHAAADPPARLTARRTGDIVTATLVVTVDEGEVERMLGLPVPGELTDPSDPADRTMLWEALLRAEDRP